MRTVDDLTMYVYRLLGEAEEAAMQTHVETCASCAETIERIESESRLFGGALARGEADPLERARVTEAVLARRSPAKASGKSGAGLRILRLLRGATAAAAALAIGLFLATREAPPPPPSIPGSVAAPAPRREVLAYVQDSGVGSLVAQDEEGQPAGELGLKSHDVSVEILDGVAKTTVEENFQNHTDRRLEGTFRFPLPPDASISRLALEVNGKIEEGTCLERERARQVFESIVSRMKDPALLEWMPGGMFQCRIFPIEPRATKRVIVAYTQVLPFFRGRMTYVYPLASEKTSTHPPEELRIEVEARVSGVLSRFESTSHRVDVQRRGAGEARMTFAVSNVRPKSDFVVAIDTMDDEMRVIPHKVDGDDGYFALFLSPRGEPARRPDRYVFVLDVSASVTAPELEVAKRLVQAFMERRIEGDRFTILAHHVDVLRGGEVDLRAANEFMDGLRPVGGSDVLGALRAAPEGEIVYIGKGRPTFGETDHARILETVKGRRIRTIGVGSKANVELLQKLGGHFRVSPSDDVPQRVAEVAATLGCPVLSGIEVAGGDAVYYVTGVRDVFYGERLMVAGRYRGAAAKLVVTGRDYRREVDVTLPLKEEGNNYVRRLWAQRKIADLLAQGDARKAEVTELGVKHQIMTPYTSFLVLESEQMWKDHQLKREVQKQDQVMARSEPGRPWIGVQAMEIAVRAQLKRIQAMPEGDRSSELEALSKFMDEFRHPSRDADYRDARRMVAEAKGDPRQLRLVSPEKVAKALENLRNSLDDVGVDIVNRANVALPGNDTTLPPPSEPVSRGPVTRLPFGLGREAGTPAASGQLQEMLRMREESERREMEGRGGAQTRNAPMTDFFAPTVKVRQVIVDGVDRPEEVRTTTSQFGGLEFTLGEASKGWASSDSGTPDVPVVQNIPILGHLFDPKSAVPAPEGPAPTAVTGFSRFTLVASGSEQSIDLPRISPPGPNGIEARIHPLKYLQPPAVYTARVEANKFISGQPLQPVQDPIRDFTLRKAIERLLSRNAAGQTVGKVDFDPQTHVFIVRDTKAVLDRIGRLIDEMDVEPAKGERIPAPYAALVREQRRPVSLFRTYRTLGEVLAEFRRQTGWQITLDPHIPPGTLAPQVVVHNGLGRDLLQQFATLAGLALEEETAGIFRLRRIARGSYAFRDVEVRRAIEAIARDAEVQISVPPEMSGTIQLSLDDATWTEALLAVTQAVNYTAVKVAQGSIRVVHPDELLRQMEVRVYRVRFIQPSSEMLEFELTNVLKALLSRDERGNPIGQLKFDPHSNTLIVRDRPAVQERINEIAAALDVEPGRVPVPLALKHFYPRRVRELLAEARRRQGSWVEGDPVPRDSLTILEDLKTELERFRPDGMVVTVVVAASETPNEVSLKAGAGLGVTAGQFFSVTRDSKFMAVVQVAEAADDRARCGVWGGLALGRVLPGDRAERIRDLRGFLSGLPEETKLDLGSRANQSAIREKLGLKE